MTNQEAINHLLCGRILTDKEEDDKLRRMCIEALEEQSEIVHCKDCENWNYPVQLECLDGRTGTVGECTLTGWLCGEQGYCMYGNRRQLSDE